MLSGPGTLEYEPAKQNAHTVDPVAVYIQHRNAKIELSQLKST